ncbi:MAG TPA: TIGR03435 family protein [Bryobacteraceae bacterium]|jgi:uncharacterized protein (TIGR03435 family)|nr:TIGR03435 family protein [Bryobacteraceae bacterium]
MKLPFVCACCVSLGLALAQQPADKTAFEVASIKLFDPDSSRQMWTGMSVDAGMVRYTNISLRQCIRTAYRLRDFQIEGPEWMNDARFEITAKLAAGAQQSQIPEMLQALLADRFKLSLRRDRREQSVYALVVGKDGSKLKRAEVKADNQGPTSLGPDGKPRPLMGYQALPAGLRIDAPAASLGSLADLLSRFTERPVVDMTALDGQYEFLLTFTPESTRNLPPAGTLAPDGREIFSEPTISMFKAVEQYGLKLERRKAPIEMLTVTHLERTPTEN